jgi:hypothetical protein
LLEPIADGTRITLRHSANPSRESSLANSAGWETSLARLEVYLAAG